MIHTIDTHAYKLYNMVAHYISHCVLFSTERRVFVDGLREKITSKEKLHLCKNASYVRACVRVYKVHVVVKCW